MDSFTIKLMGKCKKIMRYSNISNNIIAENKTTKYVKLQRRDHGIHCKINAYVSEMQLPLGCS